MTIAFLKIASLDVHIPVRTPVLRALALCLCVVCAGSAALPHALAQSPPAQTNSPQNAQNLTLKGTVTDAATGEALQGARLTVQSVVQNATTKSTGAIARADGSFAITALQARVYVVSVNAIGYKPYSTRVDFTTLGTQQRGELTIRCALQADVHGFSEIVVTGVASRTQKSVAEIAVARFDAERQTEQVITQDLSQLLAGKIAGVSIGLASGNPGGGFRFNVRSGGGLFGAGQPVIFIDGVRVNDTEFRGIDAGGQGISALADLNPEDIASIDVLKGPAASALYGTSGSNGVLMITTKRGKTAADEFTINYKGTLGWNEAARTFSTEQYTSAAVANSVFRRGALQEHALSIGGKAGVMNYFLSYNERNESGIVPSSEFTRRTARANFDVVPNESIIVKASAAYTNSINSRPQGDNALASWLGIALEAPPFSSYDSLAAANIENTTVSNRFWGSAELTWLPVEGLQARGLVGVDFTNNRNEEFFSPNFSYPFVVRGQKQSLSRQRFQWNADYNVSYTFGSAERWRSTTIVGGQVFSVSDYEFSARAQQLPSRLLRSIGSGTDLQRANETTLAIREAGIYLQQEVSFKNLLFVSAGVRNDYASAIGRNAPNIFYPRASAAFRFDNLDPTSSFSSAFTLFKLRAAYGESGQLPGVLDGAGVRWSAEPGGSGAGAVIRTIGNRAIVPESIREIELGADIELANAYGLEVTYYRQFANNSIVEVLNAPSSGLTATGVPRNVGRVDGWGFEAKLSATPIRSKGFQMDVNVIWNYQDNEVRDIGGTQPIFDGFSANVIAPNIRRSAFYLVQPTAPVFDRQGRIEAMNLVTTPAPVVLGTPFALHTGSFALTLRLLDCLTLTGLADWALGQSVYNVTRQFAAGQGGSVPFNRVVTQLGLGRVWSIAPVPSVRALTPNTPEYRAAAEEYVRLHPNFNANFIEAADFVRFRELSLRYDAGKHLQALFQTAQPRVVAFGVSVRNVALWTRYSGIDPELNYDGGRSLSRGQEFTTLPHPRTVNFTLSLGF